MLGALRTCAITLLTVTVVAFAQSAAPTTSKPNANRELAVALLQQARKVVANAPSELQPILLYRVAYSEKKDFKQDAVEDATRAFLDANAMVPAGPGETATARMLRMAEWVENGTSFELIDLGDYEGALRLARQAGVPRAPIYSRLISSSGKPLPRGTTVLGLAQECYAGDGTFPYAGVVAAIKANYLAAPARDALLRYAYEVAARERQLRALAWVAWLFSTGHTSAPELDSELEPAAEAAIGRMRASPAFRSQREGPTAAGRILSVLAQIDPSKAAELHTDMSWVRMPNPHPPALVRIPTIEQRARAAGLPSVSATLGLPDARQRFQTLIAIGLYSASPGEARGAAEAAAQMATPALVADDRGPAGRLAAKLGRALGDDAAAAGLLGLCLDGADAEAREVQADYDSGSQAERDGVEAGLERTDDFSLPGAATPPVTEPYAAAALVIPQQALRRAQALPSPIFRPLVIARVAEVVAGTRRTNPDSRP